MWMPSILFLLGLLGATAAQPFSPDGEHHPQVRDVHGWEETRRWLGDLNSVLAGMSDHDSEALDGFNLVVHGSGTGTNGRLDDFNSDLAPGASTNDMEDAEEFNSDWNGSRARHFGPKVNCDPTIITCLSFLNELTESVVSRNTTNIRKHFSESFHFKGCLKIYNREDIVATLVGTPAGTGVFSVFRGAKVYDISHTKFNATIHGVLPRPFTATFILIGKTTTLLEGHDTECLNI